MAWNAFESWRSSNSTLNLSISFLSRKNFPKRNSSSTSKEESQRNQCIHGIHCGIFVNSSSFASFPWSPDFSTFFTRFPKTSFLCLLYVYLIQILHLFFIWRHQTSVHCRFRCHWFPLLSFLLLSSRIPSMTWFTVSCLLRLPQDVMKMSISSSLCKKRQETSHPKERSEMWEILKQIPDPRGDREFKLNNARQKCGSTFQTFKLLITS